MNFQHKLAPALISKNTLEIAKWFNNKNSAISLRFDDNLDSHVKFVVPRLNKQNIKASFMINPGRNNPIISYKRHKDFWENELPQMGHRLGNHTWNHKGAKNLEVADFEIGEVSKLIWKLYPNDSKLNVFASGGGETWGGRRWRKAAFEYKELTKKYFLLDLYSSEQQRIELNSHINRENWRQMINETIKEKKHRAFVFHNIGKKNFIDYVKQVLTGYNNCFDEEQFINFIFDLKSREESIWIAPVIDILKYEKERESAEIALINSDSTELTYSFNISTDANLLDHPLTIVSNLQTENQGFRFLQNEEEIINSFDVFGNRIFNIKPITSKLLVKRF